MDLIQGLFSLDNNCVLFLYRTNNDGLKNGTTLRHDGIISGSSAAVNVVHYSYPCGAGGACLPLSSSKKPPTTAGQFSIDGIEHGNTMEYQDKNNRTIDDIDPFCNDCSAIASPELACCADSCQTCTYRSGV